MGSAMGAAAEPAEVTIAGTSGASSVSGACLVMSTMGSSNDSDSDCDAVVDALRG